MQKQKGWKSALWIIGIIGITISIAVPPVIVYFATKQPSDNLPPENSNKIDLENIDVYYLADAVDANEITNEEANEIQNGIQGTINAKMTSWSLEEEIDYQINNLDKIQSGINLISVLSKINIVALSLSEKARGVTFLRFNARENITNRFLEIKIPANQEDGFNDEKQLGVIKNNILIWVQHILTQTQINQRGIDYEILNFELLVMGAQFKDYKDQIIVTATTTTSKLKGSFPLTFTLS